MGMTPQNSTAAASAMAKMRLRRFYPALSGEATAGASPLGSQLRRAATAAW
jgi:hypothetical protein